MRAGELQQLTTIDGLRKLDDSGHREVDRNVGAPRVLLNNDFAIGGTQSEAWVCLWITSIGAGYRWFAFRRWQTPEPSIGSKTDWTQGSTCPKIPPASGRPYRIMLYLKGTDILYFGRISAQSRRNLQELFMPTPRRRALCCCGSACGSWRHGDGRPSTGRAARSGSR